MSHPDTPELDQPLSAGHTGAPLTRRESREIVTPYAFAVDHDLWGVPTASPMRRLIAMGIDTAIISALANASVLMIAVVMGYLMYCRALAKKTGHVVLVAVVTALLLATAVYAPESIVETDDDAKTASTEAELNTHTVALLVKSGVKMRKSQCEQQCMDAELDKLIEQMADDNIDKVQGAEILDDLMDKTDYPAAAWAQKRAQLVALLPEPAPATPNKPASATPNTDASAPHAWYEPPAGVHSLLEWGKSLLLDIGFGVGWAVFYFTFTIYWCHGQTLGKKLLGIKVIQLDGQELNLFNAFSRQGGYGAGFATGLLGFLQVYWDPNRQAIQDKVVSTVVIRLGQPKRPLTH